MTNSNWRNWWRKI